MSTQPEKPGIVRVDFYKRSGKWYMTQDLDMTAFHDHGSGPEDAVIAALEAADLVRPQFTKVVADPYHRFAVPVMILATA